MGRGGPWEPSHGWGAGEKDGGTDAPQRDCGPNTFFHGQLAEPGGLGSAE